MKIMFDILLPKLKNKNVILIGENHGVVENALFVRAFVNVLKDKEKISFVGFEYPVFAYSDFIKATATTNFDLIKNHSVAQMLMRDGRFSKAHFELLVYLYKNGINIVFFDSGTGSWDDRDRAMYENISKSIETQDKGKILLIAGNIHTSLDQLILDSRSYKPLGNYFERKSIFLIKLQYHSGEFFNFEKRKFKTTSMPSQLMEMVGQNQADYHLESATPTN